MPPMPHYMAGVELMDKNFKKFWLKFAIAKVVNMINNFMKYNWEQSKIAVKIFKNLII